MAAKPAGWRRPGGLRSALQQAQQAAELAQAALRLPPLASSKPLFLAAQLHAALQHLQQCSTQWDGDEASGTAVSDRKAGTVAAPVDGHIAAAATHLQRLVGVDAQREANECLLFWMLVLTAQKGLAASGQASKGTANGHAAEESDSSSSSSSSSDGASDTSSEPGGMGRRGSEHGIPLSSAQAMADGAGHEGLAVWLMWRLSPGNLLLLVEAMGWEHLLARALAWDPTFGLRLLTYCSLGGRKPGLPAAGTLVHLQLLAGMAQHASRQLEGAEWGQAVPPELQAAELAAKLELVQQHLLVWQETAAASLAAEQAGPFRRLARAVDAPMAALLALSQHPGWSTSHQRLFQQLCQARARLAMLLMPIQGGSPSVDRGSAEAGIMQEAEAGAGGWAQQAVPACPAGDVWQQVLQLGGAGGLQASSAGSAAAAATAGKAMQIQRAGEDGASQALFLAAHAAVWRMWAGEVAARSFSSRLSMAPISRPPQPLPRFAAHVAALPGVTFPAPLMPIGVVAAPRAPAAHLQQHAAAGRGELSPADETAEAAALLAQDADPLGPAGLALAALEVAQHYIGSQPCSHPASSQQSERPAAAAYADGMLAGGAPAPISAAAGVLLWLAQGAAMRVDERQRQRALLQCALHGTWLWRLREAVAEDGAVQERCRRELVALSNRLADDDTAVRVFGDERQRLATLVQEILPYALLAPGAVVERLVTDALCYAGQADVIVEALAELPPLAHFSQPTSQATSYLTECLCAALSGPPKTSLPPLGSTPRGSLLPAFRLPSLLDSRAASRAFIALATRLCSVRWAGDHGGRGLLVDPRVLLSSAVLPVLRPAASNRPHPALCLALELACSLLGCGSSQGGALAPLRTLPSQPAGSSSSSMPSSAEADMHAAWVLLEVPAGGFCGGEQQGSVAGNAFSAGSRQGGGGPNEGSLAAQLLLPLLSLLDFSHRQLSRSPAALLTPLDAYSLASTLAHHIVGVLQAAMLGWVGGRPGGPNHLAPAAMQAATAVAAAAASSDGQLPDAWLHLSPLRTVLGLQGRQLAAQWPLLSPPSSLDGTEAASRLLQLCAAHAPIAGWAHQQAAQGYQASAAAGASPAATLPLGQPAAATLGQGGLDLQGHASQLLHAVCQLPLHQARRALMSACALTLPVCTPGEAARVLEAGLSLLVAAVAGPPLMQQQQQQQGALQAAVLEVACRAVHALALQPGSFPIAGEAGAAAAAGAGLGAAGQEARVADAEQAGGPSPLRRAAVERALRHLSAHCQAITSHIQAAATAVGHAATAAGGAAAAAAAGAAEGDRAGRAGTALADVTAATAAIKPEATAVLDLTPAAAAGLAVRAFMEVCRLSAALQPFYPCATLQVCLLHLIQVIRACDLEALHGPRAELLQHGAAKLEGQLGETVRFALEKAEP